MKNNNPAKHTSQALFIKDRKKLIVYLSARSKGLLKVLEKLGWFDDNYQISFPSHATLARLAGVSIRTVQRILKELHDNGIVIKVKHPDIKSCIYLMNPLLRSQSVRDQLRELIPSWAYFPLVFLVSTTHAWTPESGQSPLHYRGKRTVITPHAVTGKNKRQISQLKYLTMQKQFLCESSGSCLCEHGILVNYYSNYDRKKERWKEYNLRQGRCGTFHPPSATLRRAGATKVGLGSSKGSQMDLEQFVKEQWAQDGINCPHDLRINCSCFDHLMDRVSKPVVRLNEKQEPIAKPVVRPSFAGASEGTPQSAVPKPAAPSALQKRRDALQERKERTLSRFRESNGAGASRGSTASKSDRSASASGAPLKAPAKGRKSVGDLAKNLLNGIMRMRKEE